MRFLGDRKEELSKGRGGWTGSQRRGSIPGLGLGEHAELLCAGWLFLWAGISAVKEGNLHSAPRTV